MSTLAAPREIAGIASRPTRARSIVGPVVITVIVSLVVAGIIWQQIVHTPWGLPGHRGIFWLSALIAVRWAIDRPGVALGVAAASSSGILLIDPTMGVHVATYLIAGFLVDLAAKTPFIRRHAWVMIPLAPLILLVNLMNPFVHNLAQASLPVVFSGMWFYVQGHLLWGLGAGIVGMGAGVLGQSQLRRLHTPAPTAR